MVSNGQQHGDQAESRHDVAGEDVSLATHGVYLLHEAGKGNAAARIAFAGIDPAEKRLDLIVGVGAQQEIAEARTGQRSHRSGSQSEIERPAR